MRNRLVIVMLVAALVLGGLSLPRPAAAGAAFCHTVRPGETLAQIAALYGVTVQAIVDANNLWNPNLIYVGQCLIIPGADQPAPGCKVYHTVKRGEYLKQIAARYGVSWQSIAQANGLKNANLLYPGQRLLIPIKCQPPKPKPTPKPPTVGPWTGKFWANRFLSGTPKYTRTYKNVDFNWGAVGPKGGIGAGNFSARFTRTRSFDAGKYRFRIRVDDGVRFWLDGVLLIDEWHDSAAVEYTVEKQLSAGDHSLQIDYYQNTGVSLVKFSIETVNGKPAWTCSYFNNTNLQGAVVATTSHQALDFRWGTLAPAAGVTADYYSMRCTGDFSFVGGSYRFAATVDDGVRVWVGDQLIIDQWHLSAPRTYEVNVDVGAGMHPIKVEYFENNGQAVLKLLWTQR